jgi:hypothetical protein
MDMRTATAACVIAFLLLISSLPVVGFGQAAPQLHADGFSPHASDPQVPGLIGTVWPNNVLAGSSGDLIIALSASGFSNAHGWDTLSILIPPEFHNILPEQVISTLTNNYANIVVRSLSGNDRYAPGWTMVSVTADGNSRRQFINFTTGNEWYYVRMNGLVAPSIAGEYFFKMQLFSSYGPPAELPSSWVPVQNWPVLLVRGELDPASIAGTVSYGGYSSFSGAPVEEAGMVLAHMTSKLDPRTGATLYPCPQLGAPPRPGCVDAAGYFNATDHGQFNIEGVAAGIFDVYAEAAGYPTQLVNSGTRVSAGQSLHLGLNLSPGVVIQGYVYSKHQFGEEPWPENSYVKIELYDQPTSNLTPDPGTAPVSWSPLPCIAGGQNLYVGGSHAGACGDPRSGSSIAFPWHAYGVGSGFTGSGVSDSNRTHLTTDPQGVGPAQHWYVVGGSNSPFRFQFGSVSEYGAPSDLDGHVPQVYATWINGLPPGQYYLRAWVFRYVQSGLDGSTFRPYSFVVGGNDWAGDISVPLDLLLSSSVEETVHFHNQQDTLVTSTINTGAGYLYGALEDSRNAILSYNVTSLGFTNITGTYRHNGYSTPLKKQPTDRDPNDPAGVNRNSLQTGDAIIQFWGINDTWNGQNCGIPAGTYNVRLWATGYLQSTPAQVSLALSGSSMEMSDHLFRGAGFQVSVASNDWETPAVSRNWMWNGQEIDIGFYKNATLVSVIGEEPAFMANVVRSGSHLFQDGATSFVSANGGGQNFASSDGASGAFFGEEGQYQNIGGFTDYVLSPFTTTSKPSFGYLPTAFHPGQYDLRAWTYGYFQAIPVSVYAQPGQVANARIALLIGVSLSIDLTFAKERLAVSLPADASARVRFFDERGRLVAEWMSSEGVYPAGGGSIVVAADGTSGALFGAGDGKASSTSTNYVPAGTTLLHVTTAGLPLVPPTGSKITRAYYGDPVFRNPIEQQRKMWRSSFDVNEMKYPYFADGGILGSPYYSGGWSVEIDMVNWYTNGVASSPPPEGLLLGESFHAIPGTVARSGMSYTEDAALNFIFIGHTMAANHLGPYAQNGLWLLYGPPSGGSSSGVFQVYIGQSGNQIPEFTAVPSIAVTVLVASIVLLRRKKREIEA